MILQDLAQRARSKSNSRSIQRPKLTGPHLLHLNGAVEVSTAQLEAGIKEVSSRKSKAAFGEFHKLSSPCQIP